MKIKYSSLPLLLLSLLLGSAVQAEPNKPSKLDTAPAAIAPVAEAPVLSATAKMALGKISKRVTPINTDELNSLLKTKPETVALI